MCEASHSSMKLSSVIGVLKLVRLWYNRGKTCLFIFYRIGCSEVQVRGTRNQGAADTDSRLDFPYAQMQRLVFGMGGKQATSVLAEHVLTLHHFHPLVPLPLLTCNLQ